MSEKAANEQSKTLRDLQKLRRAVAQDHLKNKQKKPQKCVAPWSGSSKPLHSDVFLRRLLLVPVNNNDINNII